MTKPAIFARLSIATVVTLSGLISLSSNADVYPKENFAYREKANAAGGTGTLKGYYAFTRDNAKPDEAIKEVSWLRLEPGTSIGYHPHASNEDVYVVVSGTGVFRDKDGVDKPIKSGDVTIVRKGESHAISNTGSVSMMLVDVIAQQ